MKIPARLPSIPIRNDIRARCAAVFEQGKSIVDLGYESVGENTCLALDAETCVVLGKQIGEGLQGCVFELGGCPDVCIKVCKNEPAAKQFRRELLGYAHYINLDVPCPTILGADGQGTWILKVKWPADASTGAALLQRHGRVLPPDIVRMLGNYVRRFENAGWCVDGAPSNVVFLSNECGNYETTLWPSRSADSWTFARCFLPMWLPRVVPQVSERGWPPYTLPPGWLGELRKEWLSAPQYAPWREVFGGFPDLSPEWWTE